MWRLKLPQKKQFLSVPLHIDQEAPSPTFKMPRIFGSFIVQFRSNSPKSNIKKMTQNFWNCKKKLLIHLLSPCCNHGNLLFTVVECSKLQSPKSLRLSAKALGSELEWCQFLCQVRHRLLHSLLMPWSLSGETKTHCHGSFQCKMYAKKSKRNRSTIPIYPLINFNWCVLTIRLFWYSFWKNGRRRAHPTCKQNQWKE